MKSFIKYLHFVLGASLAVFGVIYVLALIAFA